MTTRDDFVDWTNVTSRLLLAQIPEEQRQEIAGWLAVYHRDVRAATLSEVADFVRDAHFREGMSVQEIGVAVRLMAAAAQEESQ